MGRCRRRGRTVDRTSCAVTVSQSLKRKCGESLSLDIRGIDQERVRRRTARSLLRSARLRVSRKASKHTLRSDSISHTWSRIALGAPPSARGITRGLPEPTIDRKGLGLAEALVEEPEDPGLRTGRSAFISSIEIDHTPAPRPSAPPHLPAHSRRGRTTEGRAWRHANAW